MATNLVQEGDLLTLTAPAAVTSGQGVMVGVLFGVAQHDADSGAQVTLAIRGVYTLPKTSAQAWTEGAAIYWDPTPGEATTATTAGNLFIGHAAAAASNPSATGAVRLSGGVAAAVE